GWFLQADSVDRSEPASTILVLHGNAGNVSSHLAFVEHFPGAGFNVFLFDYRGYGRSEKGKLRRGEIYRDAHAALELILSRRDVARDRIAIYAQSLGAAFGLPLMAERSEIRAAVIVSAFSCWREMTASVLGGDRPGIVARMLSRWLMPAGLDPIEAIVRINDRPVLLVHGTADEVVPYSHAERLVAAGGSNVSLRSVEGGDHNGLRWYDSSLDEAMAHFLKHSLNGAQKREGRATPTDEDHSR
ncbi:MAG: alpha/beta fold hydrolase, partial [Acidobacteriota bacterium]